MLDSEGFRDYCQVLRVDFKAPSRSTLQRRGATLYDAVHQKVLQSVAGMGFVAIAVDGWKDHQSQETLAACVIPMNGSGKPVLFSCEQQKV